MSVYLNVFFLKIHLFYLTYMNALPACVYVQHVCACMCVCAPYVCFMHTELEERVRSSEREVTESCRPLCKC